MLVELLLLLLLLLMNVWVEHRGPKEPPWRRELPEQQLRVADVSPRSKNIPGSKGREDTCEEAADFPEQVFSVRGCVCLKTHAATVRSSGDNRSRSYDEITPS